MDIQQKQSFLTEGGCNSQVDCDVNCPATGLEENKQNFTFHVEVDEDSEEIVEVLEILDPEIDVDIPQYQQLEMGETKMCPLIDQTIVDNGHVCDEKETNTESSFRIKTQETPLVDGNKSIEMEEEKQRPSLGSRKTNVDKTVINFDAVIQKCYSMEPLQTNSTYKPILNRYDLLTSIKQHINLIQQKQSLLTDGDLISPIGEDGNCPATELQENEHNFICNVKVKEDPDEVVEVFEILEPESNSVDIPLNIASTEYQHLENKISPLINQTILNIGDGGEEKETKTESAFQIKTADTPLLADKTPIDMDEKDAVSSGCKQTKLDESIINAVIQNYFSIIPPTKHTVSNPILNQGALLKSIKQHINLQHQSERNIFNIIEKRCKQMLNLRIARWREISRLRKYNQELTKPEEIAMWETMCEWRRRCIKDCRHNSIPEIRKIAEEVKRFYSLNNFNPKNPWIKAFRHIFKNVRFNNNSNNTRKLPRNILSIYNAIKHNLDPSIVMRMEAKMTRKNLFYKELTKCLMKPERNATYSVVKSSQRFCKGSCEVESYPMDDRKEDELFQRLHDGDFKRKASITKRVDCTDYCEIIDCIESSCISQRLTWKDVCGVIHDYFTLEYLRLWPLGNFTNPPEKFNEIALRTAITCHVPKQRIGDKLVLIVKYIKNILLLYMANNCLDIKFLAKFFDYSERLVQIILDSKILKKLADSVIRNMKNLLEIQKEANESRFSDGDIDESESENGQMMGLQRDKEQLTNDKRSVVAYIEADDPLPSSDVVDLTTDDQTKMKMSIKSEPADQILTLIKTEDTEISDYKQALRNVAALQEYAIFKGYYPAVSLLENLDENFRSEMNGDLYQDLSGNI